jgi:hypothetical protein
VDHVDRITGKTEVASDQLINTTKKKPAPIEPDGGIPEGLEDLDTSAEYIYHPVTRICIHGATGHPAREPRRSVPKKRIRQTATASPPPESRPIRTLARSRKSTAAARPARPRARAAAREEGDRTPGLDFTPTLLRRPRQPRTARDGGGRLEPEAVRYRAIRDCRPASGSSCYPTGRESGCRRGPPARGNWRCRTSAGCWCC